MIMNEEQINKLFEFYYKRVQFMNKEDILSEYNALHLQKIKIQIEMEALNYELKRRKFEEKNKS